MKKLINYIKNIIKASFKVKLEIPEQVGTDYDMEILQ